VNTVAILATIGGFSVGLAGVVANVVIDWRRRTQEVELAEKRQMHERELERGPRLYERRAPVYKRMMGIVQPVMEHVEGRNPMVQFGNPPPLPDEPTIEEQRAFQVELRTYGSKEVGDAFHDFVQKVRSFQVNATVFETIRDQRAPMDDQREQMDAARERAREAADTLARLVSDELAAL
jgi:hypothetical protein